MDDIVRQKATKCRKCLLNLRKAIEKQVASGSDNDYSKLKSYVGGILDVIENGMPEAELKSRCEKLGSYVSEFTNLEILQNAEEFASNAQKVKKADFSDFLTEFNEGQTADDQRFWAEAYAEESEKSNPIPEEPEPTMDEPQYDMEDFWKGVWENEKVKKAAYDATGGFPPETQTTQNQSQSQPSGQTQSSSQNKSSGQSQSTEKKKDGNGCCGCITFLIIGLLIYGAYKMWPDIKAWFGSSNDVNPETAAYVIAESLNLRGGPEKSAGNIMDRLFYGTPVQPEDGDYGEWKRVKAKDMTGYVSSTGIVDYESFNLLENAWGDEATRKLVVELRHRMALIKFCRAYDSSGDFKLGDFGIAKTSDHTTKATKTGTYGYMAPEVYWGRPYNASVDLYSLGMVLYWILNERRGPFLPLPPAVPKPAQHEEAMERRMHGEALPEPKNGSAELKRIVLKACAFDAKDRYRTPTEFKQDLLALIGPGEEIPIYTVTPKYRLNLTSEPEPHEETVSAVHTQSAQRPARQDEAYDGDRTVSASGQRHADKPTELPVVQEDQEYEQFCIGVPNNRIPLGYSMKDAKKISIPLKQAGFLSLYFGNTDGRKKILQNFLYAFRRTHGSVLFIAAENGSAASGSDSILDGYPYAHQLINCKDGAGKEIVAALVKAVEERKPIRNRYCEEHGLDQSAVASLAEAEDTIRAETDPLFVVIENFVSLTKYAKDEELVLKTVFEIARYYNILFVAGYNPDDTGKLFANGLQTAFNPDKNVILFGGKMDRQNLITVDSKSTIKDVLPKFGRGLMGYRGKTYTITMPCGEEQVEMSEEEASIF